MIRPRPSRPFCSPIICCGLSTLGWLRGAHEPARSSCLPCLRASGPGRRRRRSSEHTLPRILRRQHPLSTSRIGSSPPASRQAWGARTSTRTCPTSRSSSRRSSARAPTRRPTYPTEAEFAAAAAWLRAKHGRATHRDLQGDLRREPHGDLPPHGLRATLAQAVLAARRRRHGARALRISHGRPASSAFASSISMGPRSVSGSRAMRDRQTSHKTLI